MPKLKFGDRMVEEIIEILGFLVERTGSRHLKQSRQKYIDYAESRRRSGQSFVLRFRIRFDVQVNDDDLAAEVYLKFF